MKPIRFCSPLSIKVFIYIRYKLSKKEYCKIFAFQIKQTITNRCSTLRIRKHFLNIDQNILITRPILFLLISGNTMIGSCDTSLAITMYEGMYTSISILVSILLVNEPCSQFACWTSDSKNSIHRAFIYC